jgi:hypothetical protein
VGDERKTPTDGSLLYETNKHKNNLEKLVVGCSDDLFGEQTTVEDE